MNMTKAQMREQTANVVMSAKGVTVTKLPTKLARGSDDSLFVHARQAMKDARKADREVQG